MKKLIQTILNPKVVAITLAAVACFAAASVVIQKTTKVAIDDPSDD